MSVGLGPPQVSPDGKWIWDGQKWLPIPQAEPVTPAAAPIPYSAPEPQPAAATGSLAVSPGPTPAPGSYVPTTAATVSPDDLPAGLRGLAALAGGDPAEAVHQVGEPFGTGKQVTDHQQAPPVADALQGARGQAEVVVGTDVPCHALHNTS